MSRTFVKITSKDLEDKIKAIDMENCSLNHLTPVVADDLSKVSFDTENITNIDGTYSFGPDELVGFHVLPNGMPYLGVSAGGDWEIPVFFIIYWDGKKLRGYIPEKGNLWNTTTKTAYGNDEVADLKNCCKRWPQHFNMDMEPYDATEGLDHYDRYELENDIMERIVEKGLVKTKRSSKVKNGGKKAQLMNFTDEELLAELQHRAKSKGKK